MECDELKLALSDKGSKSLERNARKQGTDFKLNQGSDEITTVQVVTAFQRNGDKYLKVVAPKRLSKKQIQKTLVSKLVDSTIIITYKHSSFKSLLNPIQSNINSKVLFICIM
jgi:hypothetical protein